MATATLVSLKRGRKEPTNLYGQSKSGIIYKFNTPVPTHKQPEFAKRIQNKGRINTKHWSKV